MISMTEPETTPFGDAVEEPDGAPRASDATDARLVDEARRGDTEAFGKLVIRYERRVRKVIRRFISDADLADDLVQEAFLKAFKRLDQFDPSRRFGPWLFRIAVNGTYDHLRKVARRGRWSLFSESGEDRPPEPSGDDPRLELDLSQEVKAALEEIPETYRVVLVLRDLESFSTSEVAAITERTEATIRWRLGEARKMFRDVWERRERVIESTKLTNEPSIQERDDD